MALVFHLLSKNTQNDTIIQVGNKIRYTNTFVKRQNITSYILEIFPYRQRKNYVKFEELLKI